MLSWPTKDQPQQVFDETRRLPERHPEEHFHRQARLDSGITVGRLSATLAGGRGPPTHPWIEPYRQRPPALERLGICRPVCSFVVRASGSAHALQLSH